MIVDYNFDLEDTEHYAKAHYYSPEAELVKQTCETFTRLLLSITPYKAKEFVERNCAKVTRKIVEEVSNKIINKGGEENDDN